MGKLGKHCVENGRPTLPFIADSLIALLEVEHVTLGEPDPTSCDVRPVTINDWADAVRGIVQQAGGTALSHVGR